MGYDAQGRRVFKQTDDKCIVFAWDGDQLFSDKENRLGSREFVYYPDTFEPLALIDSDQGVYYYQNDAVGLPQEIYSSNGSVVWSSEYEAFGETSDIQETLVSNPIRFQGQYYDEDLGLSYNRYRYYDSQIGSFVSQDPLRLAAGIQLYLYTPNVWGWVDPYGLKCETEKFVRYMSEEEMKLTKKKGGLVPDAKSNGRKAKWISRKGSDRPKTHKNNKYKVEFETKKGTEDMLKSKSVDWEDVAGETKAPDRVILKPNEPGSYGVGSDVVDDFNSQIVGMNITPV